MPEHGDYSSELKKWFCCIGWLKTNGWIYIIILLQMW